MSWAELIDLGWKIFLGIVSLASAVFGGWKARQMLFKEETREAIANAEGKIELVDKGARDEVLRVERSMTEMERRVMDRLTTLERDVRDELAEHARQLGVMATKDDIRTLVEEIGEVAGDAKGARAAAESTAHQVTLITQHLLGRAAL